MEMEKDERWQMEENGKQSFRAKNNKSRTGHQWHCGKDSSGAVAAPLLYCYHCCSRKAVNRSDGWSNYKFPTSANVSSGIKLLCRGESPSAIMA